MWDSFHCFQQLVLVTFHYSAPAAQGLLLEQAPLSPQHYCSSSSFACSIPLHSHSAGHLRGLAIHALSALLYAQNGGGKWRCAAIWAYNI